MAMGLGLGLGLGPKAWGHAPKILVRVRTASERKRRVKKRVKKRVEIIN